MAQLALPEGPDPVGNDAHDRNGHWGPAVPLGARITEEHLDARLFQFEVRVVITGRPHHSFQPKEHLLDVSQQRHDG